MFSILIDSSVKSTFNSKNKIANFNTKLPKDLILFGNWVVGVRSICYPKSWHNLLNAHTITLFDEIGTIYKNDLQIEAGYYDTPQKLVNEINKLFKIFKNNKDIQEPELLINENNNFVSIKPGKDKDGLSIYPNLGSEIEEILGFRGNDNYYYKHDNQSNFSEYIFYTKENTEIIKGLHPAQVDRGYHKFFLYSDIVEPVIVGNTYSPLLLDLEVKHKIKFGDYVYLKYDKPDYVPVMLSKIDSIEVALKDHTNELIPFQFGSVTVRLEFKKL
jgi:hypothetical protein